MLNTQIIPIRSLDLSQAQNFHFMPDEALIDSFVKDNQWRKLEIQEFQGIITAKPNEIWLEAALKAKLTQSCVISQNPVSTPIHTQIKRRYVENYHLPPQSYELKYEEDFEIEPLPKAIDLWAILTEEILLCAPEYPTLKNREEALRRAGVISEENLPDEDTKRPFANLKAQIAQKNQNNK